MALLKDKFVYLNKICLFSIGIYTVFGKDLEKFLHKALQKILSRITSDNSARREIAEA